MQGSILKPQRKEKYIKEVVGGEKHLLLLSTHLQPLSSLKPNIPSTTLATNCPPATIAILVETIRPRTWAGAHSAR